MKISKILLLVITFGITIPYSTYAQFITPTSVVSGGGGQTSNASFRSIIAVGQPVIGHSISASNVTSIGFFYPVSYADLIVGVEDQFSGFPTEFMLEQNYPNPFNPQTSISYYIPHKSSVELKIYNQLGQEVKTLISNEQSAGNYQVQWNGRDDNGNLVANGVYFYRLKAGKFLNTRRMVVLK